MVQGGVAMILVQIYRFRSMICRFRSISHRFWTMWERRDRFRILGSIWNLGFCDRKWVKEAHGFHTYDFAIRVNYLEMRFELGWGEEVHTGL